jgi:hypothetical protein
LFFIRSGRSFVAVDNDQIINYYATSVAAAKEIKDVQWIDNIREGIQAFIASAVDSLFISEMERILALIGGDILNNWAFHSLIGFCRCRSS